MHRLWARYPPKGKKQAAFRRAGQKPIIFSISDWPQYFKAFRREAAGFTKKNGREVPR